MSSRTIARRLRERAGNESGVVLVLVAVLLTAMLASAALALDLGSFYSAQRKAQTAADAAALAAAADLSGTSSTSASADGTTMALTNYPGATATVSQPSPTQVKVVVNAVTPTFFGQALGMTKDDVSASAVAATTATSTQCTVAGNGCWAIWAADPSCADNGVIGGGGVHITGGVHSNGSLNVGGGGSTWGPTTFGNGSGCTVTPSGFAQQNNNFTSGPAAEAPVSTWPIDYSKDFPACGGSTGITCTGPCTVNTSPCPGNDRTPSWCTQATNAASQTLQSFNPVNLASGQIYCDVGSGTNVVASDPTTWTGALSVNMSSTSSRVASSFVAGTVTLGGSDNLTPCGFSASGFVAASCSSVPAPVTTNYPIIYATQAGTSVNANAGGITLLGDVFAPLGTIFIGGGTSTTFLEGFDVNLGNGGITGDGSADAGGGEPQAGGVALIQ